MTSRKTTIAILTALSASLALADDFKTVNRNEYKNATVTGVEPDGITVKFSGGIVKIPFTELPKEVQERFHYNQENAAASHAAEMAAVQQTNQQIQEANTQRRDVEKELTDRLSALQEEEDKLLAQIRLADNATTTQQGIGRAERQKFEAEARENAKTPRQKARELAARRREYEGAKTAAARRGLDSNMIIPPQYGKAEYDPFGQIRGASGRSGTRTPTFNSAQADLRVGLAKVHNEKERVRQELLRVQRQP